MQAVTLLMIVVVTTFEFFAGGDRWGDWAFLPSGSEYMAEILSVVVVVYVIFAGAQNRFERVRGVYWILFGALLFTMVAGIFANAVGAGPIFAGLRSYLRAIPWFFLPAVYSFSDREIKQQLYLLLLVALLQSPFAIQQTVRTSTDLEQKFGGGYTGDWTWGTLMTSTALSIFVISGVCLAAGLLVRKRIAFWQFVLLFVALLVPATINETKATFLMLPLGLMTVFLAASSAGTRLRNGLGAVAFAAVFISVAVPIYDYTVRSNEWQQPIGEMLTDPDALEKYLLYEEEVGTTKPVGKGDTVVMSLRVALQDPVHFALGHGIGNVSRSALGPEFTGRYFHVYGPFTTTTFGGIVFELGLLGLSLVILLFLAIFKDAVKVAHRAEQLRAGVAAGFAGVTTVILLAIPYTEVIAMSAISYLFWYFAGLVAVDRMKVPASADRQSRED